MKTEYIKQYQKEGWITRQEAMAILDKKDSGSLDRELKKAGIHYITMPWENSEDGDGKVMYRLDQVKTYQKQRSLFDNPPVAGESNGGRMASRMKALEDSQKAIVSSLIEISKKLGIE